MYKRARVARLGQHTVAETDCSPCGKSIQFVYERPVGGNGFSLVTIDS